MSAVNFIPDPATGKNKQVGDVDFEAVKEKASGNYPGAGRYRSGYLDDANGQYGQSRGNEQVKKYVSEKI